MHVRCINQAQNTPNYSHIAQGLIVSQSWCLSVYACNISSFWRKDFSLSRTLSSKHDSLRVFITLVAWAVMSKSKRLLCGHVHMPFTHDQPENVRSTQGSTQCKKVTSAPFIARLHRINILQLNPQASVCSCFWQYNNSRLASSPGSPSRVRNYCMWWPSNPHKISRGRAWYATSSFYVQGIERG